MFKAWLEHPLTRELDIDDPATTELRRQIIQEKSFLRQIYREWYTSIAAALPAGQEPILELGAGAGFLSALIPGLITSEILCCPGVSIVLDGQQLPFGRGALRAVVMTNVLHHLSKPRRFFREAARCVLPGGVIVMIEPWVTAWSRLIYERLHHEPFCPEATDWDFPAGGPVSGANSALPWIIFARDRSQFAYEFPEWNIEAIKPIMPFQYLLSGGVALRSLMPGWTFGLWRRIEHLLQPWANDLAMFAQIVLRRTSWGIAHQVGCRSQFLLHPRGSGQ